MTSLDLWPIGNCQVSALIDLSGNIVWACVPRVDGDPLFSSLLGGEEPELGFWAIDLDDCETVEQEYLRNTPILVTRKTDWFTLQDAKLQLLPYSQPHMEMAVASSRSPVGAVASGKHGIGMLSIGGGNTAPSGSGGGDGWGGGGEHPPSGGRGRAYYPPVRRPARGSGS